MHGVLLGSGPGAKIAAVYPDDGPRLRLARQANLPLFNGCSLLCDAIDISLVSSDGAGNATKSWSIPTTMVITQFVQFLPVADQNGALVLRASNGVRVDCSR